MARRSFRSKVVKATVVIAVSLTLMTSLSLLTPKVAHAWGCPAWNDWGWFGYGHMAVKDNCSGNTAFAYEQYCPETGQYARVQSDSWVTQQPWTGGTRYFESGRSAVKAILSNCQWYWTS